MNTGLQKYFPMIRTRAEVLAEIKSKPKLSATFRNWKKEQQKEFLDYVTGAKGVKVLYDALLQEQLLIPLDIFRANLHNKGINNELDAWLTFLSADEPEIMEQLIKKYPQFKPMYQQIYEICRNTERVMGLYSEELKILDKNTVQLMIDEMQDEIDGQKKQLSQKDEQLTQKDKRIERLFQENELLSQQHRQQLQEIERLKKELAGKMG